MGWALWYIQLTIVFVFGHKTDQILAQIYFFFTRFDFANDVPSIAKPNLVNKVPLQTGVFATNRTSFFRLMVHWTAEKGAINRQTQL